jgi:hypothetical protein
VKVKLARRWGSAQPGDSVTVDDTQGRWLVQHAFGTAAGEAFPTQPAAAPGSDGEDPLAGGDATRRNGLTILKGERRPNHALPVPGSPVQYNAGVAEPTASVGPRASGGRPTASEGRRAESPSSKDSSPGRKRTKD